MKRTTSFYFVRIGFFFFSKSLQRPPESILNYRIPRRNTIEIKSQQKRKKRNLKATPYCATSLCCFCTYFVFFSEYCSITGNVCKMLRRSACRIYAKFLDCNVKYTKKKCLMALLLFFPYLLNCCCSRFCFFNS